MGRLSGAVLLVVFVVAAGCKLQRSSSEPGSLSEAIAAKIETLREERDKKRARVNERKATRWLKRACRRSSSRRFTRAVSASKYAELAEDAGWTTTSRDGAACRKLKVVAVAADGPTVEVAEEVAAEPAEGAGGGGGEAAEQAQDGVSEGADGATAKEAETDAEEGD